MGDYSEFTASIGEAAAAFDSIGGAPQFETI